MKKLICSCWVLLLIVGTWVNLPVVAAEEQPVNEDELFSGPTTGEEQKADASEAVDNELNQQHFGISGQFDATSTYKDYLATPNWFGLTLEDEIESLISTDLCLDLRFKNKVKTFISWGAYLYPDGRTAVSGWGETGKHDFLMKEAFVDANLANKVYFRVGKQVLKWGRSYFWNPTDLINLENKDFFDLDKNREGTTGVKVHIPSGVKRNIYFFANLGKADSLGDDSLAGQYEWLVGKSEMSLLTWYKDGYQPVFGYDISSRIGKVDWWGEISLFNGKDLKKLDCETASLLSEAGYSFKVSIGCGKYFDYGEIKDRINLIGEFYYNQAGYDDNYYQKIAAETDPNKRNILINEYMKEYQPYHNSKYYFAVFGSVSKFLIPELTLSINGIANLVDHSAVLTSEITYKPTLKDYQVNFGINTFLGDSDSEACFSGNNYQLKLGLEILF
jgi:hypothetical protein